MTQSQAKAFDYDPLTDPQGFKLLPMTVLDTTTQWWQRRKGQWLELGLQGEVQGRERNLLIGNQQQLLTYTVECDTCARRPPKAASVARATDADQLGLGVEVEQVATEYPKVGEPCVYAKVLGCAGTYRVVNPDAPDRRGMPVERKGAKGALGSGTSLFDPVLAEAIYRWYSPPNAMVLDPFAGGDVRSVVAHKLGRRYVGVELRSEQVAANNEQIAKIFGSTGPFPVYAQGDSRQELAPVPPPYPPGHIRGMGPYDFAIACPPYYDAERYSDDPRDLSNADSWDAFRAAHWEIIGSVGKLLADDRFAVWVVGEARGKDGYQYGIVPDTINAFNYAGLRYYGDFVLRNATGTVPMRLKKQWQTVKPGRIHQHVLVFVKGSAKGAAANLEPLTLEGLPEQKEGGDD